MATLSKSQAEKLAKEVGGKVNQGSKGNYRVEYQVKGKGYKSTKYLNSLDEAPNYEAPRSNPRDPVSHETSGVTLGLRPSGSDLTYEQGAKVPIPGEQVQPPPVPGTEPVSPQAVGAKSYEEAVKNLNSGGLSGESLAMAGQSLASKYQKGFAAAQGAGITAPQGAADARGIIDQYTPETPETGIVDSLYAEGSDPVTSIVQTAYENYLTSTSQKVSLMDDYKKLYRSSGLDELNEELIDAETIIDGTEDDIRNEIATAGGFGTESQVQALSLARNKGLLKRYNQLFAAKQDATQQLNMMLNLTIQDRQMAQQRAESQLNTAFKLAEFKQSAINAVREDNRWKLTTFGADGVYDMYKGNPRQLELYERALGLSKGGLAIAAADAASQKANDAYLKQLQIIKAEQDVGIGLPETPAGSVPSDIMNKASEGERKGLGFLNRSRDASQNLDELEGAGFDFGGSKAKNEAITGVPFIGGALSGLQSEEYKKYKQAAGTWIKAVLRLESGATIPPDEEASYFRDYFPAFGDSAAVREQKAEARASAERGLESIAGRLAPYANQAFSPASFYE